MPEGLIRAYGEFWSPDLVDWGRPGPGGGGALWGRAGNLDVNVWDQLGVYVLHHEWQTIYVGRIDSANRRLGQRLREHLNGRLAGRWDRFSWYGMRAINKDGSLRKLALRQAASLESVIRTMEAVLLRVGSPSLNIVSGNIPGAKRVEQEAEERPRPIASMLVEIRDGVDALRDRVDRIEGRLDALERRS
jgi:hypothetical protein